MVHGSNKNNLHVDMTSASHSISSGLAVALGGNNEAPDPHVLLEASLAACTILTLQLYANRKQWDLGGIEVDIKILKENKEGTVISRSIAFTNELDAEKIDRLTEIANKCPIHNLLVGSVAIETTVRR
jgi:putative redox protein